MTGFKRLWRENKLWNHVTGLGSLSKRQLETIGEGTDSVAVETLKYIETKTMGHQGQQHLCSGTRVTL